MEPYPEKPRLEEGEVEIPKSRFPDAKSVRNTFQKLFEDDKTSSAARAQVTRMIDGTPPYTPAELRKSHQSGRTNVNFGEGEDTLNESLTAYVDMMQSVERLFTLKTEFGETPSEREQYSEAISRKMTHLIRKRWSKYHQRYLLIATHTNVHGVSFCPFPDDITWQYDVKGLGEFFVPRDCDATEDSVPYAFFVDDVEVADLYAKIRDEEAAESMGWDIEATKKALVKADRKSRNTQHDSWQKLAERLKSDDIYTSSQCDRVQLIYTFVAEYSGKVSMLISTRENGVDEFLYKRMEVYPSMSRAFVSFTFGIGTSGKYYGIRSLGSRLLAPVTVNNRMLCQHIDGGMMASSLLIQPGTEADLGKVLIAPRGPYTVLHPSAKVTEGSTGNFAQNTIPVSQQMTALIRSKAGSFTSARALPEDREMSQYEASARIANAASLSATNLVLHMTQSERLYREQVRRMIEKNYPASIPGGVEIEEALAELEAEGVPRDAWYAVDVNTVAVVYPVGAGSAAARGNAFRRLAEIAPAMDEEGQRNLYRDRAADALGSYEQVDRYFPQVGVTRLPDAAKMAMMENILLKDGAEIAALSEEFHVTHLDQHGAAIMEIIVAVDRGEAQMEEVVESLVSLHDHATQHLEFMAGNLAVQADSARFRQMLQQAGEIILNGMRKLEAMRQRGEAERQQAAEQGGQESQPDPKVQMEMMKLQFKQQEFQMKLENMRAEAETKMQIQMLKANTDAAIADAKAAKALSPFAPSNVRPTPR
jgi:hypothetical protein